MKPTARMLLGACFLILTLAASACFREDEEILFAPEKADELAHAVLPAPEQLPGSGWAVAAVDEFDEGDDELPANTLACRKMIALSGDIEELTSERRAGRAKVELHRPGANDIDTEIEVHVSVFEDTATPEDALQAFRAYFESSALRDCFGDLLSEAIADRPNLEVEAEPAEPVSDVVGNAESAAFVVRVTGEGFAVGFRTELYAWRISNVGVAVEVAGAEEDVVSEDVAALLEAVQLNLKEASRPN